MPKFIVTVEWKECGEFEVYADSIESAKQAVFDDDEKYCIGNADGEYVDDSFKILSIKP